MKKARKGVAANSMACALFENSMVGIKHQSLLQDYEELHNVIFSFLDFSPCFNLFYRCACSSIIVVYFSRLVIC